MYNWHTVVKVFWLEFDCQSKSAIWNESFVPRALSCPQMSLQWLPKAMTSVQAGTNALRPGAQMKIQVILFHSALQSTFLAPSSAWATSWRDANKSEPTNIPWTSLAQLRKSTCEEGKNTCVSLPKQYVSSCGRGASWQTCWSKCIKDMKNWNVTVPVEAVQNDAEGIVTGGSHQKKYLLYFGRKACKRYVKKY